jgi:putative FmdB family regulatory protein
VVIRGFVKTGDILVPIYEYQCQSCSHELEKLQKMNEEILVDCPECEQPALKKLVSAAAFRLKGSGWYETDFKKDNKRNLADGSGKNSTDKESAVKSSPKVEKSTADNSSKKPDAKPAAKAAANP